MIFTLFSQFKKKNIYRVGFFRKKFIYPFYRLHMNFKMYRDNDVGTTGVSAYITQPDPATNVFTKVVEVREKGSEN